MTALILWWVLSASVWDKSRKKYGEMTPADPNPESLEHITDASQIALKGFWNEKHGKKRWQGSFPCSSLGTWISQFVALSLCHSDEPKAAVREMKDQNSTHCRLHRWTLPSLLPICLETQSECSVLNQKAYFGNDPKPTGSSPKRQKAATNSKSVNQVNCGVDHCYQTGSRKGVKAIKRSATTYTLHYITHRGDERPYFAQTDVKKGQSRGINCYFSHDVLFFTAYLVFLSVFDSFENGWKVNMIRVMQCSFVICRRKI